MYHQARRFVNHQEGVVFINNLQCECFGDRTSGTGRGDIQRDDVSHPDAIASRHHLLDETHLPLLDESLQLTPGEFRQMRREVFIEASAAVLSRYFKQKVLRHHALSPSLPGSAERIEQ
jgi:hypothetical protein